MRRVNFVFLAALVTITALTRRGGVPAPRGAGPPPRLGLAHRGTQAPRRPATLPRPSSSWAITSTSSATTAPPWPGTPGSSTRTPLHGRRDHGPGRLRGGPAHQPRQPRARTPLRRHRHGARRPAVRGRPPPSRASLRADQGRSPAAAEAAELEDLLGQCFQATSRTDEAEQTPVLLQGGRSPRIRRGLPPTPGWPGSSGRPSRGPTDADRQIEAMVAKNPGSALALVERYRYRREFGLAPDKADIARALELAPTRPTSDPGRRSSPAGNKDLAAARRHLERGIDKHPERPPSTGIAGRHRTRRRHPDRAEAILRRGIARAAESAELKLLLTEALLDQGKLDGDDGAIAWIERIASSANCTTATSSSSRGGPPWARRRGTRRPPARVGPHPAGGQIRPCSERVNVLLGECHDRLGRDGEASRRDAGPPPAWTPPRP